MKQRDGEMADSYTQLDLSTDQFVRVTRSQPRPVREVCQDSIWINWHAILLIWKYSRLPLL